MDIPRTIGYTEIVKIAECALDGDSERAKVFIKRYIGKYPDKDLVYPFTHLLNGVTNPSGLNSNIIPACEGKADSTSEKDLRVCSVNGSALFQSMGEFAYKAFPDATSVEHLKKLKIEADEAIEEPKNIIEYSDCLLALFGAAHKAGFTYDQLLEASQSKFEILKTRNWEKLSDGTYQHCH